MAHETYHDPSNVTNPEHADHHIVSPLQYCMVFGTLLLGTAITVLAAYKDMGWLNPVIALGIASFKAVVVILFFMHVKYQSKLIKMTVAAGFFTFIVLITMTLSDYMSRAWGMW
ncbi:cytochrome C oxidase subunit IV family protein [Granulicella mallensis]|jgi:cytochrome c oxidase subunit 4|uniref:Caa(3)-type oxidase, subunit IV n=2 Tax=Granulicella mallensis TaxID=940614 RepID=G8NZR7_GRAMM|nr:cytochrome C oxidase subunit IV family protein [Granulicella mallensis]AEU34544.1 caa(3)-type oxidase, subunit IV [Granulicella mallensis MP5ACTX8]MBB5063563.1 cytochrome c oxidase subunit 4 [Granulicella mallensis]